MTKHFFWMWANNLSQSNQLSSRSSLPKENTVLTHLELSPRLTEQLVQVDAPLREATKLQSSWSLHTLKLLQPQWRLKLPEEPSMDGTAFTKQPTRHATSLLEEMDLHKSNTTTSILETKATTGPPSGWTQMLTTAGLEMLRLMPLKTWKDLFATTLTGKVTKLITSLLTWREVTWP